jgi:hypothetical protein
MKGIVLQRVTSAATDGMANMPSNIAPMSVPSRPATDMTAHSFQKRRPELNADKFMMISLF